MKALVAVVALAVCALGCGDDCQKDEDCVPKTCCHPRACVPEDEAPDCEEVGCSLECQAGTMDCGKGRCVCDKGECKAQID